MAEQTVEDTNDTTEQDDRSDFLATALERFKTADEAERELREEARLDLRFEAGKQWDEQEKQRRQAAGRPALTFNRCHTFVQQVANEARQRRGEIKFVASDSGDKDTPEVLEGLARHIQYNSEARVAYETATEYAVAGGFGYFRFLTDYYDDESDDQELKVCTVHDPMSVYGILIPTCYGLEPQFAFVVENMPREEYEAEYGDGYAGKGFELAKRESAGWIEEETVRVAEYWYITARKVKRGKRSVLKKTIHCAIINGVEVLEETEWPGKCIPIFAVLGKKRIIEGKPELFGVIRFQRDPQRMINFYKTGVAERIQQSPVAPYIGYAGQFEGFENQWKDANTVPRAYLEVNAVDVNGQPASLPQRQIAEPPIAALSNAAAQEIDDMKATAGIYDASLGAQANEVSGIAIQRRQQQSDNTNMHFLDNLERAFDQSGRELAYVIPKIYDTKRMVRILGPDDSAKLVRINDPQFQNEKGEIKHYRVGGDDAIKYDVIVTMGRSYSTKRMESYDFMVQVIQSSKTDLLPMLGDVLFQNSDTAGSDILADRFKKLAIKNGFAEDDQAQQQIPPQIAAQMQALQQQNQQLTAELNKALDPVEAKKMEIQGKIQLARIEWEGKLAMAEIQTKAQDATERARWENDLRKDLQLQALDHQHDAAMATMNAEHDDIAANNDAQRTAALQTQQAQQQQEQEAQQPDQEAASE